MNSRWLAMNNVMVLGLMALLAFANGCHGIGAQPPQAQETPGSLPFSETQGIELARGTSICIHLQRPISSLTAEVEQSFSAVLDEPLFANGRVVAGEGALVNGRVVAVRKSGHLRDGGYLRVTLSSLTIAGKEFLVQTSSVFVEGGSFKNRSLVYMSGGAAGDGLLEALAGKSAADGSSVTVSGRASAAYVTGNQEVGFTAGHKIEFRLLQPVNIS